MKLITFREKKNPFTNVRLLTYHINKITAKGISESNYIIYHLAVAIES